MAEAYCETDSAVSTKPVIPVRPHARPRVAAAYKRILAYIREQSLGPGKLLPKQQELRAQIGGSNDTVSEAMRWLIADGVVERERGIGTVVIDPCLARQGFAIGLIVARPDPLPPTPYVCTTLHYLKHHLSELGCWFDWIGPLEQSDLLEVMSRDGELPALVGPESWDAIVSLVGFQATACQRWWQNGLLSCHAGADEQSFCGTAIDHQPMVADAVRRLASHGSNRLALVVSESSGNSFKRAQRAFATATADLGLSDDTCEVIVASDNAGKWSATPHLTRGISVAELLRQRQPEERPDGLIIVDDYVAAGVAMGLWDASFRPMMALQSNLQIPLGVALPAWHYAVDLNELARRTANLTLRILRRQEAPMVDWVAPSLQPMP